MKRLLVIDDDTELCELLVEHLSGEGFRVDTANDGRQGIDLATEGGYDAIILDVMLPVFNGFEVLSRIRARISTPVVMLTARGDETDRIVGLELGADDYLSKPFSPRELVARLRAILRRTKPEKPVEAGAQRKIEVGDVTMDLGMRIVLRQGKPVELTSVEFGLLEVLLRNSGTLVSRKELAKTVLGRPLSPFDRSIDVHISKLRKKLGDKTDGAERIKTIRSAGYIYTDSPDD